MSVHAIGRGPGHMVRTLFPGSGGSVIVPVTWDITNAVGGQGFSNGNKTYTGSAGYGQAVLGTTAISGKKFWTVQAANGTASNDMEMGVSQVPINHQTSVGGGSAGNSDGKGYAYQTSHGWVQGPYDGAQITSFPYYTAYGASNLIGVGYDSATRLLEFYRWTGAAWLLFTDKLSDATVQAIPQLDVGTYYPAASCYGAQSATIDGNPAHGTPAGYTVLDS